MTYRDDPFDSLPALCGVDDVFRDLTAAQRAALDRRMIYASYPSGHVFYSPGEQSDRLLVVQQGRVRLYKLSPEGRALTLFVLGPQGVFGETALSSTWQHDCFAEAMTECVVGAVGRDVVRSVLRDNAAVAMQFMDLMSQRVRILERKLADIAFKSVPQRLATILLNLAACLPAPPDADAPPAVVRYTHQQLAEMIGSYRETVTKAVGEFREAGLIRIEEDSIFLTNVAGLQAISSRGA